jgi:hypothetical protein
VWDTHLGLRWSCSRCLRADFKSERSMIRHQKDCKGSNIGVGPVICGHCKTPCPSQKDMDEHARACVRFRCLRA